MSERSESHRVAHWPGTQGFVPFCEHCWTENEQLRMADEVGTLEHARRHTGCGTIITEKESEIVRLLALVEYVLACDDTHYTVGDEWVEEAEAALAGHKL